MNNDAFYFPHFCNARRDIQIRRLMKELGVEGYGIYFMILEVLREQANYKYPLEDIDLLADEFNISEQKINVVIGKYKLFNVDEDDNFYSPKLIEYMQPYLRMKEQTSLAGKASAEKRRQKLLNEKPTTVALPLSDRRTTVQQSKVKESKVKEIKEKKEIYEENVYLTKDQHEKLTNQLGEKTTKEKILDLSLYLKSTGKQYKCHYSTILAWNRRDNRINSVQQANKTPRDQGKDPMIDIIF